jgi:ribosomal protein S18 acetylase RimI-like enzyme
MIVRTLEPEDRLEVARLLAAFRVELAALRGRMRSLDVEAADCEIGEFLDRGYPLFVAEEQGAKVGLLVCRVDGTTVWAEGMYVLPEHRRRGVGRALYAAAERLAASLGEPTVYNWIHPDNAAVIGLLCSMGYNVLNLIEVRRPYPEETPHGTLRVGAHEYRY